jgi:Flp pilus assembly protein TadB
MIPALIAGAGVGLGIVLIVSGLVPSRLPLAVAAARLHEPRPTVAPAVGAVGGASRAADAAISRLLHDVASAAGLQRTLPRSTTADLRVTGDSLDAHVASRMLCAIVGFGLVPATGALMWAGGTTLPMAIPGITGPLLGVAGYFVPTLTLRSRAEERRRSFRHALSSFLDLVSVSLAGGAGVETALQRSVETGQGWAYDELRHALLTSNLLGNTPWAGLDELGVELGVIELRELAASVALAGEDGARVRASIAAKARALRSRSLTDTEADAEAATERMSLPIVVLMAGFMVFVVSPAIFRILTL